LYPNDPNLERPPATIVNLYHLVKFLKTMKGVPKYAKKLQLIMDAVQSYKDPKDDEKSSNAKFGKYIN
jgi:hypothetical protein